MSPEQFKCYEATPEHVQFISKEILGGLNWILLPQYLHYHNIFTENLRKVDVRKQRKERNTTQTSKNKMPPENKQDVKPEPVCIVQSDLSEQGSGIVSLSVTNLAEIPIWSPCSSQISMAGLRASTEIESKRN